MEVKELINKIASLEKEVYNYVLNTEHWLFYWMANKEVQDFIREYPEDYADRVHLQVRSVCTTPSFTIVFDDHPNGVESINRTAALHTFRYIAKANWLVWNGKVKEIQIQDKEKELAYHKEKVNELEKELLELKNA